METRHRSSMRLLAPVALVVFAIALVLVIAGSGGGGESKPSPNAAEKARDLGTSTTPSSAERHKAKDEKLGAGVYIVKRGDTLGGIAEKTGVPVDRLQELHPGLDQFSLVAGQRIKLR
jgi:LysM repeat protein